MRKRTHLLINGNTRVDASSSRGRTSRVARDLVQLAHDADSLPLLVEGSEYKQSESARATEDNNSSSFSVACMHALSSRFHSSNGME